MSLGVVRLPSRRSAFRILLVEDTVDDADITLYVLRKTGLPIEVEVAHDGSKAIAILNRAQAERRRPDLVLLDRKLPRMSGIEVLECIRENPVMRDLPIVCFTNSAEPKDVTACYAAGGNSLVQKPIEVEAYVRAIGALATFWLEVNLPTAS